MIETRAVFRRKDTDIEPSNCVIDKVIRLSSAEFDNFSHNLMREWDFIRDNKADASFDEDGRHRCILVISEEHNDGILVNSEGADYARRTAFIPNAEALLTAGRYPALAALNKKLADIVDYITDPGRMNDEYAQSEIVEGKQRYVVDLMDIDVKFGIDLMYNGALLDTVLDMFDSRPEIMDLDLDKNELILYRAQEATVAVAETISDPTVTPTDMYAYGYSWDGMIPLGQERALELYDQGYGIFRLYENDAEGLIDTREEINVFDGLFGTEDPAWTNPEQEPSFQVFILNREKYDKGEVAGEWLTLPADTDTLRGLLERIGVEKPSEGAFTVTSIRVPQEYLRDHISKYDSLDELNMLASYLETAADYHELDKYHAILSSGIVKVGNGAAALINLLDSDNLDGFNLIDAKDAESLGRYYARENDEKSDDASFEEYGIQCIKEEGGKFTEWGYITFRYKDLSPEYTGVVPDEYKIVAAALRGLQPKQSERSSELDSSEKPNISTEKPSVIDEIKASRRGSHKTQRSTPKSNEVNVHKHTKRKGGPEL